MKKLITALALACLLSLGANAQILTSAHPESDSLAFARVRARMDSIRQYRPTVGLVLAGGGARGLAHLGVIKYMEELGIPVDVITGTSMGGLVGGLYALGYRHDELDSLVRDIQWPVMMSDDTPNEYLSYKLRKYRDRFIIRIPFHYDDEDLAARLEKERVVDLMAEEAGHSSSERLQDAMNKFGIGMPDGYLFGLNVRNMLSSVSVGYQDSLSFAELPIPYACVATDLYSMTPKYWTSGNLNDALRSTMAIPFYFRAVRQNGEVLLDGGMRNNFPVDLAKEMGADIIIGSEMSVPRQLDELNNPVDFLFQTITLLSKEAAGPAREMLDLDVHHELKGYNMLSFDDKSVDDIIDQGYRNALANKELFESIAAVVAGKEAPSVSRPAPAINLARQKVCVGAIEFRGIPDDERHLVLSQRDFPNDTLFDRSTVERLLNNIYGSNVFESVTYHLEGREAPYTLVFDCQKGQVNDFAIGLRADTDETVAAALHLGLGTRRLSGPRFTADIKLGTSPVLALDFAHKSRRGLPTLGATFSAGLMNTMLGWMNSANYKQFYTGLDAYLEDFRLRNGSLRLGVSAEMTPYEHYLSTQTLSFGWDWKSYWLSGFAKMKLDTFDDGYFPTRGVRLSLSGRYVFNGKSLNLQRVLEDEDWEWEEWNDENGGDGGETDYTPVSDGGYGESEGPGPDLPEDYYNPAVVEPYASVLAGFQAAFSIGEKFTVLPSAYIGWNSLPTSHMSYRHAVSLGGFMQGRYVEHQIPFFGFATGFRETDQITFVPQLDLRYCFLRKNYATVRSSMLFRDSLLRGLFVGIPVWAVGAEYSRQSIVGPLRLAVQYCSMGVKLGEVTVYASIGFDF